MSHASLKIDFLHTISELFTSQVRRGFLFQTHTLFVPTLMSRKSILSNNRLFNRCISIERLPVLYPVIAFPSNSVAFAFTSARRMESLFVIAHRTAIPLWHPPRANSHSSDEKSYSAPSTYFRTNRRQTTSASECLFFLVNRIT